MHTFRFALLLSCVLPLVTWPPVPIRQFGKGGHAAAQQVTKDDADAAAKAARNGWVALLSVQVVAEADVERAAARLEPIELEYGKVIANMSEADKDNCMHLMLRTKSHFLSAIGGFRQGNGQSSKGEDWRVLGDAAYMAMNWHDAVRHYAQAKNYYASAADNYADASHSIATSNETAAKVAALLAKYKK